MENPIVSPNDAPADEKTNVPEAPVMNVPEAQKTNVPEAPVTNVPDAPQPDKPKPEGHYFAPDAWVGRALFSGLARFLSGASSSWISSQPDTCQRVYFANHTSHLDILVIWSALPSYVRRYVRPVAANDYWSKGIVRPYIAKRLFNAILLERHNVRAHHNPVDFMLEEMGDRYSIIIFPEGGRQSSGTMAEFKSGLYYMCKRRPELELIPIYIDNMNRILPRGSVLPVPLLSHVMFGPPMWLEENEKKQDFLERARQAVLNLKKLQ